MMEKSQPLQQMLGENWLSACRNLKLDLCLSPCTTISSKWIRDLNIRPEPAVSIGKSREYSGSHTKEGPPQQNSSGPATKRKDGQMDYMKLKSFCITKEMVSKLKRPPTEWEKIFASYTLDKGLITRIYKGLKKLNSPKINVPIKK
jgi:hypothetical protein